MTLFCFAFHDDIATIKRKRLLVATKALEEEDEGEYEYANEKKESCLKC